MKLFRSITFWLFFLLPFSLGIFYLFVYGSPRYEAIAHFTIEQAQTDSTDGLGILSGVSASPSSIRDGLIVKDFIESRGVIEKTKDAFNIQELYAREDKDWLFRLQKNASIEDIVDYWKSNIVTVDFDLSSGVTSLYVLAYEPEDALTVINSILKASDELVNTLSEKARLDTLSFAREELTNAEKRLKKSRLDIQAFKDKEKTIVSPEQTLEMDRQQRLGIITSLESELATAEAALRSLRKTLHDKFPKVREAKNKVASLKTQVAKEKAKLDQFNVKNNNKKTVAATLTDFEELKTDQGFAEQLYLSALTSLEHARTEASKKHRYLTITVEPKLPEEAAVPRQPKDTFVLLFACLLLWGIMSLIIASIKDHAGWV